MSELFLHVFNNSITAGYLVIAVMLLRGMLVKAPKYIRYIFWGMVGIRLLIPVSVESVFSLVPSREVIPANIGYQENPVIHVGIESVDNLVNPILTENFAANPAESVNPMQVVTEVASYVWLFGILLLLGYTIFSYMNLKKRVWDATRLQDNIYQSERIATPFVLGLLKPRIYVPYGLSETECNCVLVHERIHIRRKDYLIKPLAFLLLTVYWFQPLFWIAYVLLCKDIELSCDEKAIAELGESAKKEYSETLLNLCISNHAITACPIAFGETSVKTRIKNVINYKKPTVWILLLAVIGIIAVAVCFMTSPKKENAANTAVSGEEEEPLEEETRATFHATILEISGDSLLAEAVSGSKELASSDLFYVSKKDMPSSPEPQVGDEIEIVYNGEILETYPAGFGEVYSIKIVSEASEDDGRTTEVSSTETEGTSLSQLPLKEQLKEETQSTLGIPIEFTPNEEWIAILSYQCSNKSAKVQYRDDILGSVCDLQAIKDEEPELPEWEFDDNLEESWSGYTKSEQYVEIKVQITKDGKNALATWKYEDYHFAIQTTLPEGGSDMMSVLPKTAIYIIQHLN